MRAPALKPVATCAGLACLIALGLFFPGWLVFILTLSTAQGLAVLGVVTLSRGGGATFGQGLFYAIGAYGSALAAMTFGLHDALLRVVIGVLCAAAVGALVAPLLARYRGIFFAMLTLALSMLGYGIATKSRTIGGSDGLNLPHPTLLGWALKDAWADFALYALTVAVAALAATGVWVYFRSKAGLISQAVRSNEIRALYLGAWPARSIAIDFTISAVLGGAAGALAATALGHVDPQFGYWTQSGEFVFAAILAGTEGVFAAFIASFLLEIVRSFSNQYFPNTWQLTLGVFLLVLVLLRPSGIGSLLKLGPQRPSTPRDGPRDP